MKPVVAIVLAGNVENSPYIYYYIDVLERLNISFDIISWDRHSLGSNDKYCFEYYISDNSSYLKKLGAFLKYSYYVRRILKSNDYQYVIVFTIINAFFLSQYLLSQYRNKYIFDIRDYSPAYPYIRRRVNRLLRNSKIIVISSVGFKNWLPKYNNYVIGHNIRRDYLSSASLPRTISFDGPINIVTFGSIRDYQTNQKVMDDIGNSSQFTMSFVGSGTYPLEEYAKINNIRNVKFGGRYLKRDEIEILKDAHFINILLPRKPLTDFLITNRFYHSIVNRKPMIVTEGNIEAGFVKKYNLGIAVRLHENLFEKLKNYIDNFDESLYEKGCSEMIDAIETEVNTFERHVEMILKK